MACFPSELFPVFAAFTGVISASLSVASHFLLSSLKIKDFTIFNSSIEIVLRISDIRCSFLNTLVIEKYFAPRDKPCAVTFQIQLNLCILILPNVSFSFARSRSKLLCSQVTTCWVPVLPCRLQYLFRSSLLKTNRLRAVSRQCCPMVFQCYLVESARNLPKLCFWVPFFALTS